MAKLYKKISRNGTLTLYLGKRNYVDHVQNVDPIEGVVKIDPADLAGRKVFVQLACAFHYGREDLDVIGLSFRKDIWVKHIQLYPDAGHKPTLTPMHVCLLKKTGEQGHAFTFDIPTNLPCSVTLQPGPDNAGKACGVDFEVKTYIATEADPEKEKLDKKDTARMIVRKIQFAPDATGAPGPKADICKSFMMSDKPIHLEASLEKEIYYHGDPINVNVKVKNETAKTVKKITITVEQTTDVVLYSADKYTKTILSQDFGTIDANSTFDKSLAITPLLADNKEKRGLALDGRLKDEDTNLASNTMIRAGMDKEVLGVLVSYKIKVNLMVSSGGLLGGLTASDVRVELPLILMHPKPQEVMEVTLEVE